MAKCAIPDEPTEQEEPELQIPADEGLSEVEFDVEETESGAFLFTISAEPTLVKKVIEAQLDDDKVRFLLDDVLSETGLEDWHVGSDQGVRYQGRLFVPKSCRDKVLQEFHTSQFAVHPGGTKMYQDLKR